MDMHVYVRDAVEADAERLSELTGSPEDVMRNLVHDRTVRVATDEEGEEVRGFVSYDAQDHVVHITQIEGPTDIAERLLEEPLGFAATEDMVVEVLVAEDAEDTREAAENAGFVDDGPGPRFGGTQTIRYRQKPNN